MAPLLGVFGAQDANRPAASILKELSMSSSRKPLPLGSTRAPAGSPAPAAQINYGKIVEFFDDTRWDQLHERRLASLAFVCNANQQGLRIKDLPAIRSILARTLDLAKSPEGAQYVQPACTLVRLCGLPFQKYKSTDDVDSTSLITPLLNTVSGILYSDSDTSLKVEAAQTLIQIGSGYGQRHLESDCHSEDSSLRQSQALSPNHSPILQTVKSYSGSTPLTSLKQPLSPTSKGALKGSLNGFSLVNRNQSLLGESGSVDAAVRGFERSIRTGENEIADLIGEALLEMSFSKENAERMHEAGVLEPITRVLRTAPMGSELIHTAVEIVWNVLERVPSAREHRNAPEPEPDPIPPETTSGENSEEEDYDEEGDEECEETGDGVNGAEAEGDDSWQNGARALDFDEDSISRVGEEGVESGAGRGVAEQEAAESAGDGTGEAESKCQDTEGDAAVTTGSEVESDLSQPTGAKYEEGEPGAVSGPNRAVETGREPVEPDQIGPENDVATVPLFEMDIGETHSSRRSDALQGNRLEPDEETSSSNGNANGNANEDRLNDGTTTPDPQPSGVNTPREPFTTDVLVGSLAGLMRRHIDRGYKKGDRELLNDLLIVAGFLAGDAANMRSFIERGLLEVLLDVSCTPELAESGAGESGMGESGTGGGILQVLDAEALEAKKLAWPLVAACARDEACRASVTQSGFLLTLLGYLHQGQEGLPKWTASQVHELQKQACSCLSVLVPLCPGRIAECKGPEVLLHFLVATSDDALKHLAARALLACCADVAMKATVLQLGAIGVALDAFRSRGAPAALRQTALQIVSALCESNEEAQREFRKEGGIQALHAELLHHIASGGQSSGALLATILECVWRCVALNRKNLARFLVLEGLGLLLQLLEGSCPEIWPGLLSCLADVTENPKAHPFLHEWRSPRSGNCGAQVVIRIWEQARSMDNGNSSSEEVSGEPETVTALKDTIYGLFSNLGFSAFPYLSHSDKAKLVAIEQHMQFQEGRAWADIERALAAAGVVPVDEDQAMLARRRAAVEAAAQRVEEEGTRAEQLASQEVAAREAAFYAGLTRQREEEAAARRKKGTGTMTMRERQLAKIQKERMLERSVQSTEFAVPDAAMNSSDVLDTSTQNI